MSLALSTSRAGSQGGMSGNVQTGGLFSSIGRVVGGIARGGLALATGAGVGGAVRSAVGGGGRPPVVLPGIGPVQVAPPGQRLPGMIPALQRAIPFGATGLGTGCPQGYHPNRSSYYTSQGFVEKGTRCVKNRRRNPLNPRALDRSMGRIRSAGKAIKALGFKAQTVKQVATSKKRKR